MSLFVKDVENRLCKLGFVSLGRILHTAPMTAHTRHKAIDAGKVLTSFQVSSVMGNFLFSTSIYFCVIFIVHDKPMG